MSDKAWHTIRRILNAARRGEGEYQGEAITTALDHAWDMAEEIGNADLAAEAERLYNDITKD